VESFGIVSSRVGILTAAREEGVSVPNDFALNCLDDVENLVLRQPFPWVMKADGTWGGGGVRVAQTLESARECFAQLSGIFRSKRAIKRLVVNRDAFWMHSWFTGARPSISVQSFIPGRPANCAVVCWQGKVLAMIEVEVVCSAGATGPASVVNIVTNRQMIAAAGRLAARLQLSGFVGLDFMIEESTETAYLVEMNPRPAPPCFLNLGEGMDLAGALTACLSGQPVRRVEPVTRKSVIVYFPESVREDKQFPAEWYLDVPAGEEEMVAELLNPFPDRTVLFRLMQWWRGLRDEQGPMVPHLEPSSVAQPPIPCAPDPLTTLSRK
jgi:predicted ATP-grasp superfamily ATP-dependent carboligase